MSTDEEDVVLASEDGIFSNIGGKIKELATVITCLGIIASIIVGIGFFVPDNPSLEFSL